MTGAGAEAPSCDERLARVGLSRLVEPDDAYAMGVVAAYGPVALWSAVTGGEAAAEAWVREVEAAEAAEAAAAAEVIEEEPRAMRRSGESVARRVVRRLRDAAPAREVAERDLGSASALGARVVCPDDAEWPPVLDELGTERPLCLWVRGVVELDLAVARAVAVVGSRAATGYGIFVAGELAHGLARRTWTVVSGGAYGIDGAAHRGALAGDGLTIAVLACGVDVAYPRGHTALFDRIAEQGLVVSEWPPGCDPFPHRFLSRNRVIAALTAGTVVVEAALRSGARSTANRAAGLGRSVMAVPGPVTSTTSAGCHELLREGATCVTSAADAVEQLAPIGALGALAAATVRGVDDPRDDDPRDALPPVQRRTLEAVPVHRAKTAPAIARLARIPAADVRSALGLLEVAGFVERHESGYRLSAAERSRRRSRARRAAQGTRPGPGRA